MAFDFKKENKEFYLPSPSRNLPVRPAPYDAGKDENCHPASYRLSTGFSERLELNQPFDERGVRDSECLVSFFVIFELWKTIEFCCGRVMEKCGFAPTGETVVDLEQGRETPIRVLRLEL